MHYCNTLLHSAITFLIYSLKLTLPCDTVDYCMCCIYIYICTTSPVCIALQLHIVERQMLSFLALHKLFVMAVGYRLGILYITAAFYTADLVME